METSFGVNLLERMPHLSGHKSGEVVFLSLTKGHPFSVNQYMQGRGSKIYVCMCDIVWGSSADTETNLISGSANASCRVFDLEGNFYYVGSGVNINIYKSDFPDGFKKILIMM